MEETDLGAAASQRAPWLRALTIAVASLTVLPGRATVQEGAIHLVLAGAFVFLALVP